MIMMATWEFALAPVVVSVIEQESIRQLLGEDDLAAANVRGPRYRRTKVA
jgi:hypothetical protein